MDRACPAGRPVNKTRRLSEKDRRRLLRETLDASPYEDEFWVFGFGSLMWNPGVDVAARHTATVRGYERKFHIWSTIGRGTAERPGLGLCLEPGPGACRGIVYRYRMETLNEDLEYLWGREMGSGVYNPTWVPVVLDDEAADGQTEPRRRTALTFVINHGHPGYAGPMPAADMARHMGGAYGRNGRCRDYLANTIAEMAKLGDRDPLLEEVLELIDAEAL